jgi:hypothetical protein
MKMINLQSLKKLSVNILLTALVCTFLFVSNTFTANAAMTRSDRGEAKLNDIQKRTDELTKSTDDIANRDKTVAPSLKQSQEATKGGGINEIQGTANRDQMVSPEDAKNATTLEDKVKNAFSNLKDSK